MEYGPSEQSIRSVEELHFKTNEVSSFAFSTEDLVQKLSPEIENGAYGLVVVDQMSGHIPGFVIGSVINRVNKDHGRDAVPVIPIDGEKKKEGFERMAHEFVQKRPVTEKLPRDKKALLVTEYISHGDTLLNFSKLFEKEGFSFDVASIVISEPESFYKMQNKVPLDTTIFFSYQDYDPPIDKKTYTHIGYSRDQNGNLLKISGAGPLVYQAKADSLMLADYLAKAHFAVKSTHFK